jgi:hypothetical protein
MFAYFATPRRLPRNGAGTVPIFVLRPGTDAKRWSAAARIWDCPPCVTQERGQPVVDGAEAPCYGAVYSDRIWNPPSTSKRLPVVKGK